MIRVAAALFALPFLFGSAQAAWYEWYVSPEIKGDCGDECYEPPTAWVDDKSGNFRIGVTCDGTVELGGPGTEKPSFNFEKVSLKIDGKELGPVDVQTGLKDIFVYQTGADVSQPNALVAPMESGSVLQLALPSGTIEFSLSGSKAAIALAKRIC